MFDPLTLKLIQRKTCLSSAFMQYVLELQQIAKSMVDFHMCYFDLR